MYNNRLNWTIAYKTVFGEKKVESFTDKKEADARYEALLARTYGSLGDIAGVTKPVQSGAKVTESKEQKTPKKCESWVVDYKRLFDSEIESEEFDNLTDANEFYNRLMDDAEGYEFIDEPREVEGLEECGGSSAASLGAIPTGVVRQNDESKKSEALPPKQWGNRARKFPSRAALVNKAKTLGATEIISHDDYKKLNDDVFLDKIGFAMDINGNCKARLWWGEKDGKYYYTITRDVLDKSGW